jgi:exopolysaccharide production protein ExoQ
MQNIATLICILLIVYLFWRDHKRSDRPSNALWIPFVWMFLAGSRYVSSWLNIRTPMVSAAAYGEGSPVDAVSFFLLIAVGAFILSRRKIDWSRLVTQNKWMWLYFLYCGLSIAWADDSFVSGKRFIKELGNVVMVLVIVTEKRPYEAVSAVMRRLAYLMVPLSVLFVRYYPELGRAYHYDGSMMVTGIGNDKNALGAICMLSGLYFAWNFLLNQKDSKLLRKSGMSDFVFLGAIVWLLNMSRSSTSLACTVATVSLLFLSRMTPISRKPDRIIVLLMIAIPSLIGLDAIFGVRNIVFAALGRNASLTNRLPLWEAVIGVGTNPVIGTGFMSFWSGDRMAVIWARIGATGVNQAHNGYLEQYLNLGYIGVALIGMLILSGILKIRKHLAVEYSPAMLRLCFVAIAILYNYTEASFYGINNIWLLTLLGVIDISDQQGSGGATGSRCH